MTSDWLASALSLPRHTRRGWLKLSSLGWLGVGVPSLLGEGPARADERPARPARFGRTPKINQNAGRDHWPDCYTVVLAGGGIRRGQVYGASDNIGAYPDRDPVSPADLASTIFWRFGIDPAREIHDQTNRPIRLADGQPLYSLFG